jgi:transposase
VDSFDAVCCEIYEGYAESARGKLPNAMIVLDHFHVAADKHRQRELKQMKNELPEKEYQKLKGNIWVFLKHKANLTPEERKVLRILFAHSPDLKLAHQMHDRLIANFDPSITKSAANRKFRAWIESVQQSNLTFGRFHQYAGKLVG